MAGFSNYCEDALLNSLFGKTSDFGALDSAPTIYVALCSSSPDDTSTGSSIEEPSGGSYARISTDPDDWNSSTSGTIDNLNALTFPQATSSWGTVTHFALVDAAEDGNVIGYGSLTSQKTIDNGDTAEFAAGDLDVSLD